MSQRPAHVTIHEKPARAGISRPAHVTIHEKPARTGISRPPHVTIHEKPARAGISRPAHVTIHEKPARAGISRPAHVTIHEKPARAGLVPAEELRSPGAGGQRALKESMIVMTPGPMMTMNSAGKMHSSSGKRIFTVTFWACSSAR